MRHDHHGNLKWINIGPAADDVPTSTHLAEPAATVLNYYHEIPFLSYICISLQISFELNDLRIDWSTQVENAARPSIVDGGSPSEGRRPYSAFFQR